jgi:hypothetical protein
MPIWFSVDHPDYFVGGEAKLDLARAPGHQSKIAEPLRLSLTDRPLASSQLSTPT